MRRKAFAMWLLPPVVLASAGFLLLRHKATGDVKFSNVNKLIVDDVLIGTGATAEIGKLVVVDYCGLLADGQQFDSSQKSGQPFIFRLGKGNVIDGWDKGMIGMKVGGKRRLHIPPDMAYGPKGSPPKIPPNATLIFDVELLEVR